MRKSRSLLAGALVVALISPARAEYLFPEYIIPSFDQAPNTEYSQWDIFSVAFTPAAHPEVANYPDVYGQGAKTTRSAAGNTGNDSLYSPINPIAYWNPSNPTIAQIGTDSAFIIGAAIPNSGNIYSFAAPSSFKLTDTTPYSLGTVVFQYQTEGSPIDYGTVRIRYTDGTGTHDILPTELIREYRGSSSSFGGLTNRVAAQWDLSSIAGLTSYQILFNSTSSSCSFQQAVLDTSASFAQVVPASGQWTQAGAGSWGTSGNWLNGHQPQEKANVRFTQAAATTVSLDANRTVAELRFETAPNATLNSTGSTLLANTGITTTSAATGLYAINANYELGAFNFFDIRAGEVQLNGVVSGNYSLEKDGAGTLSMSQDNTFTGSVTVAGGTLRLAGMNSYAGGTAVLFGTLAVAADAPRGELGALGTNVGVVSLGADSTTFAVVGGGSARLLIEGNHTVEQNILLAAGTFQKTLGASNASTGAEFSGKIDLGLAQDVRLDTAGADDILIFSGQITNGVAGKTLTKTGAGTVVFAGGTKNYLNNTVVAEGTLEIGQSMTMKGLSIGAGGTVTFGTSESGLTGFASDAVPEPSSAVLLLSGASLLLRLRRRSASAESATDPEGELLV